MCGTSFWVNKQLVLGGDVRLVKDVSETDRCRCLRRYVCIGDTFVNAELGHAQIATHNIGALSHCH